MSPAVRNVVDLDIRKLFVAFPWQHWTVSYCWQLHVGQQQYKGKVSFHDNNGYANAFPCCFIRVWLALLHFVIIIDGNIERLLSLFTRVLPFLSFHLLNGDLGESIVVILFFFFFLELVKSVTFFLVKNFTCWVVV